MCPTDNSIKLEASTHKSVNTHAGNVFVTRDLDIWPFDPIVDGFPGLIVEYFYVDLVILAAAFFRYRAENIQHKRR